MATDVKSLTKAWISYLKDLQIAVSSKTEPGKLDYRKKVTSEVLSHFLEVSTDFTEEQVSNAIHMVLAKKAQSGAAPKLQNNTPDNTPQGQAPKQIGSNQPKEPSTPARKRYSKDGATDIEFRDINEEMKEEVYTLGEEDVERVFSILAAATPTPAPSPRKPPVDDAAVQSKKEEDIRSLRRIIRDKMSPSQRKALWRALTDA